MVPNDNAVCSTASPGDSVACSQGQGNYVRVLVDLPATNAVLPPEQRGKAWSSAVTPAVSRCSCLKVQQRPGFKTLEGTCDHREVG